MIISFIYVSIDFDIALIFYDIRQKKQIPQYIPSVQQIHIANFSIIIHSIR